MTKPPLYLASTSPRRRELLEQLGLSFVVLRVDVDESRLGNESPAVYVERLARAKAEAGLRSVPAGGLVIAADTTVTIDGHVLGKPGSEPEALEIWHRLSGRSHEVLTGVAVGDAGRIETRVVSTRVHFHELAVEEMQAYWASGEPADKAGGYGVQGKGAVFVDHIEGSYSNVVGLPLSETAALLACFAYSLWK